MPTATARRLTTRRAERAVRARPSPASLKTTDQLHPSKPDFVFAGANRPRTHADPVVVPAPAGVRGSLRR